MVNGQWVIVKGCSWKPQWPAHSQQRLHHKPFVSKNSSMGRCVDKGVNFSSWMGTWIQWAMVEFLFPSNVSITNPLFQKILPWDVAPIKGLIFRVEWVQGFNGQWWMVNGQPFYRLQKTIEYSAITLSVINYSVIHYSSPLLNSHPSPPQPAGCVTATPLLLLLFKNLLRHF